MTLPTGKIIKGDCLEVLREFPAASVQMVMTSPPYWGLRDYKAGAGGESLAGQWGWEATPEEHIERLVELFREIRRVLRPDGIVILNYGDCYVSNQGAGFNGNAGKGTASPRNKRPPGLKVKDLVGMPWRVALALRADGWWLRQRWPWVKLNGMPESVLDRPHVSTEEMFMLTKSERYFWDAEAVRVGYAPATIARADGSQVTTGNPDVRPGFKRQLRGAPKQRGHDRPHEGFNDRWDTMSKEEQQSNGRARKNGDWFRESLGLMIAEVEGYAAHLREIQAGGGMAVDLEGHPIGQLLPTQAYKGAHFATFPEKLVEPCIKAGTSEKGACPACGAPWRRRVEKAGERSTGGGTRKHAAIRDGQGANGTLMTGNFNVYKTTGWVPACRCEAFAPHSFTPVPCVVLDPFAGSGTTGVVAHKLGRDFVGIDLAGGNADMGGHTAHDRLAAAKEGRSLDEWQGHQEVGQGDLFQPEEGSGP